MNILTAWKNSQEIIKEKIGEPSYETWFTALHVKEKSENCLLIEVPDDFFKNWIIEKYLNCIHAALKEKMGKDSFIDFSVNDNLVKCGNSTIETQSQPPLPEKNFFKNILNKNFTFENFVIGSSNRFSCAASLAVAESPAKAYNPLLIYGQVGLGKTHLIQSITHKIKEIHPNLKICYMSSEKFTNELIDAIRYKSTSDFRKKYRNIDVLLIDDIQFIAGKESTQEEFFHTFNNLHNNHKQIIITSDRPPNEISKLEDRLSSRFAWGLITDIQPPDFETRVAILRKKMENSSITIPDDVILFIAEQIQTNIRELEGALIRVSAYFQLEGKSVTLDMAKIILKDMVSESSKIISMEMIQKQVCSFFNVSIVDLQSKKRMKNIVNARHIAMYLSRQLTQMSFPEIGKAFGGKDHTTVLHSYKKITNLVQSDTNTKNIILSLSTKLQH